MMRLVCSAIVFIPLFALTVTPALAQTSTAVDAPFYAEGDVAATLGHSSGSAYGAEAGYQLNDDWHVYLEAGHMGNITTADAEVRADTIAGALGTTANVVQKGNYFDVGVRYRVLDPFGRWHPYVTTGLGLVSVDTETVFDSSSVDVALGSDLSGHVNKPLLVLGFGVTTVVSGSWFADLSYRFGRLFANGSAIEDDKGTNTQRVQVGFGLRF
jgi:opacity protein-like surface antigen